MRAVNDSDSTLDGASAILPSVTLGITNTEPVFDDRRPLLPLSSVAATRLAKEGEGDRKDWCGGEGDDHDRQNRELQAGLHPLQVFLIPCCCMLMCE